MYWIYMKPKHTYAGYVQSPNSLYTVNRRIELQVDKLCFCIDLEWIVDGSMCLKIVTFMHYIIINTAWRKKSRWEMQEMNNGYVYILCREWGRTDAFVMARVPCTSSILIVWYDKGQGNWPVWPMFNLACVAHSLNWLCSPYCKLGCVAHVLNWPVAHVLTWLPM